MFQYVFDSRRCGGEKNTLVGLDELMAAECTVVFMFLEEADQPFMVVNIFIHVKVYLISKKKMLFAYGKIPGD